MNTQRPVAGLEFPAATAISSWTGPVADYEDRLHAVRSSLAGLSGALQVLTSHRGELPESSSRRLEMLLVDEVERLRRLVAPGSGTAVAVRETDDVDVDGLVGQVVLGRRMAGQEVAWAPSGCHVQGRADDVVEAINVLLVNAWRHTQGAPARIEATHDGAFVHIDVVDSGPGVAQELRDRIFERGVSRPGSPGQGLGLAMARGLIEDLGGSLALVDTSHRGTSFRITLPAAAHEAAA